jgi:hypothetical protein
MDFLDNKNTNKQQLFLLQSLMYKNCRVSTLLLINMFSDACGVVYFFQTYENIFMAGGVKTIHDPDHNNFMR